MNPVFDFRKVSKAFGRQVAIDEFSLAAEPGTIVALLGENGAGKTTALRILLGLLEPDGGSARVFGMDSWLHGDDVRRRVGYVPDQPSLYDWMTVDEMGWFCGGFYTKSFVDEYRRMVCEFELPLKKKIGALSKGMRAKIGLALAMAHHPELLVLDEPTSGLDPVVRREFLQSMVDVAASGQTVLLSSHQISEVERVADIVAILRDGKLQVVERLDELKSAVCEMTVTLRNGATDIPAPPGSLIHRIQQDRQWKVLLRDLDESELDAFQSSENVGSIDIRRPNLEEIYVGYMQGPIKAESVQ